MKTQNLYITFLLVATSLLWHPAVSQSFKNSDKIQLDSIVQDGLSDVHYKQQFTYDFYGRLLTHYTASFDNNILQEAEYNYQYKDNGKQIVKITKRSTGGSELMTIEKTETFLNEAGLIVEQDIYEPDEASGDWKQVQKNSYSYNEKGNRVSSLIYKVVDESGVLKPYRSDTIEYNTANMPEYITVRQLVGTQLKNHSQVNFIYGADTILKSRLHYIWNGTNRNWVIDKRYQFSNENLSKVITEEKWDYGLGDFVFQNKVIYVYNEDGDITSLINYSWDDEEDSWQRTSKKEYDLDYSIAPELIVRPVYYGIVLTMGLYDEEVEPKGRITNDKIYDVQDNDWHLSETTTYYYSPFKPAGVAENNKENMVVYPNPATEFITLKQQGYFTKYEILTVSGVEVQKGSLLSKSINISTLPAGNYLLKITGSNKQATLPFVKR